MYFLLQLIYTSMKNCSLFSYKEITSKDLLSSFSVTEKILYTFILKIACLEESISSPCTTLLVLDYWFIAWKQYLRYSWGQLY